MKKVLIFVIALIMPVIVLGATCDLNKDRQTTNARNLTCDAEKSTVTNFKTTNDVEVLKNDVCTIKCSEELAVSIDPIKKVLAGMSFSYPLYVSGERKCTATYNYAAYEAKIQKLTSEYASLSGTAKTTKGNELVNYYAQRRACDNFTVKDQDEFNEYKLDANVSLSVETSTREITLPYVYEELLDYTNIVTTDETMYDGCSYSETNRTCTETDSTVTGWKETARVIGKYTMSDVYVEKYTGEIKNISSEKTCVAGDRFFVDLKEISKPLAGDTRDLGYKLTLTANNLGDNMLARNRSNWNLTANCYYQVKNLIYPQQDATGRCIDEMCNEIGTTGFAYRIVDLKDPFPNREPGANWKGKETIITSTADRITSLQRFVINLNRNSIKRVREYNSVNSYDTFDLNEMEKSNFIIANQSIINRK